MISLSNIIILPGYGAGRGVILHRGKDKFHAEPGQWEVQLPVIQSLAFIAAAIVGMSSALFR